jgi:hypothetical protein
MALDTPSVLLGYGRDRSPLGLLYLERTVSLKEIYETKLSIIHIDIPARRQRNPSSAQISIFKTASAITGANSPPPGIFIFEDQVTSLRSPHLNHKSRYRNSEMPPRIDWQCAEPRPKKNKDWHEYLVSTQAPIGATLAQVM